MNDLQLLNNLDLQTLNNIKGQKSQRLNDIAENLAAHKIQAMHKGQKARREIEEMKTTKKRNDDIKKSSDGARLQSTQLAAVLILQRMFRRRRDR